MFAEMRASTRALGTDFRRFFVGQIVGSLGSALTLFALPLVVYKLTGSALSLGIATAAGFLPYPLFGLVLGAWADRANRKTMMIYIEITRALLIASIPLLASLHLLEVWWIYIVLFASTTLKICFDAGRFAAVPSLVGAEHLVQANGYLQACSSAAYIVGPLLAGALVTVAPVRTVLLFDALSFAVSAISLTFVKSSFTEEKKQNGTVTSLRRDVGDGLRYLVRHPVVRSVALMLALLNFVAIGVQSQLVVFAKQQFGATDTEVSFLYSAGAFGVVVLALSADKVRRRFSFSKTVLGALLLRGLGIGALATTQQIWLALPLWALVCGLAALSNISMVSLGQAIAPRHMLGRVRTTTTAVAWSAVPLGAYLGGLAIEWTRNVALVYGTIGLLVCLIAMIFSFTALGSAERYLPPQEAKEQGGARDDQKGGSGA